MHTAYPKPVATHQTHADQGARGRTGKASEEVVCWRQGSGGPRHLHVVADSDAGRDVVGSEPGEPLGTDKFPVCHQAVDLVAAKHLQELSEQVDTLLGIGVAFLGQELPEERKGDAVMDPFDYRSGGQDEEVDRHPCQHPLGSVQGQGVGGIG